MPQQERITNERERDLVGAVKDQKNYTVNRKPLKYQQNNQQNGPVKRYRKYLVISVNISKTFAGEAAKNPIEMC